MCDDDGYAVIKGQNIIIRFSFDSIVEFIADETLDLEKDKDDPVIKQRRKWLEQVGVAEYAQALVEQFNSAWYDRPSLVDATFGEAMAALDKRPTRFKRKMFWVVPPDHS
jgi:hypothetical protein